MGKDPSNPKVSGCRCVKKEALESGLLIMSELFFTSGESKINHKSVGKTVPIAENLLLVGRDWLYVSFLQKSCSAETAWKEESTWSYCSCSGSVC